MVNEYGRGGFLVGIVLVRFEYEMREFIDYFFIFDELVLIGLYI